MIIQTGGVFKYTYFVVYFLHTHKEATTNSATFQMFQAPASDIFIRYKLR